MRTTLLLPVCVFLLNACGDSLQSTASAPVADAAALSLDPNAPPPRPGPTCAAHLDVGVQWDANGQHHGLLTIAVSNLGDDYISVPWTLTLVSDHYTAVDSAWNWEAAAMQGGYVEGQATATWQMLQPNGGNKVSVGGAFASSAQDLRPTSVLLNGQPCLADAP